MMTRIWSVMLMVCRAWVGDIEFHEGRDLCFCGSGGGGVGGSDGSSGVGDCGESIERIVYRSGGGGGSIVYRSNGGGL